MNIKEFKNITIEMEKTVDALSALGSCSKSSVADICRTCPFSRDNSTSNKSCVEMKRSKGRYQIMYYQSDTLLIESCREFKDMIKSVKKDIRINGSKRAEINSLKR